MCGFVGFFSFNKQNIPDINILKSALQLDAFRGPDDHSLVYRPELGVGLGFNRLAIQDLSINGRQPIYSSINEFLVFNGEIYNFSRIRKKLEDTGENFIGSSDSEVLFKNFSLRRGQSLADLEGMYAFAFISINDQKIFLTRDPMGEKPLYYAMENGTLFFGSTARAVNRLLGGRVIDEKVRGYFLNFDTSPRDKSIYQGINKVLPGECIEFSYGTKKSSHLNIINTSSDTEGVTKEMASKNLDQILRQVVEEELVADVPVGVLLSGGIDSSLIASYCGELSSQINSFSLGFHEKSFDESAKACSVAKVLGTKHHHINLLEGDFYEFFDQSIQCLDEPLGDPSFFALWNLSKFARGEVKVALTGDGADELFWGYPTFKVELLLGRWLSRFPKFPPEFLGILKNAFYSKDYLTMSNKIIHFLSGLGHPVVDRNLRWLCGGVPFPIPDGEINDSSDWQEGMEGVRKFYLNYYLPLSILTKSDRASMAHSLELRAPFLHPKVFNFSNAIPRNYNMNIFRGKILLREILKRRHPELEAISKGKKHGFAIPLVYWLRTPVGIEFVREKIKNIEDEFPGDFIKNIKSRLNFYINNYPKYIYNFCVYSSWRKGVFLNV